MTTSRAAIVLAVALGDRLPQTRGQGLLGAGRVSRAHNRLDRRRWARTRRRALEAAGWRCGNCGKSGRLECHHRVPLWRDPGQDPYDLAGIEVLCRRCHIAVTARERRHRNPPSPAEARWRRCVVGLHVARLMSYQHDKVLF